MKQDIYAGAREWAYKNVRRRIIAEKFIGNNEEELMDYKFFCFNGIPRYCQVISGRGHDMSIDFYDKNWTHQPFHEPKNYPFSRNRICPPVSLQKMLDFSQLLSAGIPFIRVDFYEIDGHPYLGELTFYPTSGIGGFDPEEWDHILGNYITLLEG